MLTGLVWFRRDIRAYDHAALHHALEECDRVFCVFIFDTTILAQLPYADRRVEFIWHALVELDATLHENGGALIVRHGDPLDEIPRLVAQLEIDTVYLNRDEEPLAIVRDQELQRRCSGEFAKLSKRADCQWRTFKDQVIFEGHEVLTLAGKPFSVFTPYKNAWLRALSTMQLAPHLIDFGNRKLAKPPQAERLPTLAELGFAKTNLQELKLPTGMCGAQILFREFIERIDDYAEDGLPSSGSRPRPANA